ncbi:DUF817 domain-containing protein [Tahibacter amnicola]|uniref:DUF817 domain-containing protein n=1 Tax=Tahibacter amnicola TaxID=2976241 RepID=A0ABY6BE24_9GAMM|nr:DUF817 domain-containing protein [Tahibacter amnicola]UXI68284.1 DUF817 domain-containing protein [Tahibacter amnicola]
MHTPTSVRVRASGFLREAVAEFLAFGLKEVASCLFAGGFFLVLVVSTQLPPLPIPRYDLILIAAIVLQILLVVSKLETLDELKTICLFHVLGFALEVFKTHPAIGSWSYPEPGYTKLFGVPLYSGFMYAAVASYMIQAWRWFGLELTRAPDARLSVLLAAGVYLNFFTHHWLPDLRWWLAAALALLFARTRVHFTPWRWRLSMPVPLSFCLIGFFIWVAENIATFYGAWMYPDQHAGWRVVHTGKISSWLLLASVTFVIVADLKHYRAKRRAVKAA